MTDTLDSFESWLCQLPKAELHLHIDGSLEPSRLLKLAEKNKITLPYSSVEEVEQAYQFENLQSFLDLYYLGASVLREEEDFYDLMMDYLLRCKENTILHTEIMVEPQTYLPYGVDIAVVMAGFKAAISDAKKGWGQSTLLILSFLRHLSEKEALDMLATARPYKEDFVAIGLASSEQGNPPGKFTQLYQQAQSEGYRCIAHAGEEGPPAYIWDALNTLKVDRIDHGVRCVEDSELVAYLRSQSVPLTVCPLSNVRLCVFDSMKSHNILKLLDQGLMVTVNSDDPTYFGGFLNDNYLSLYRELEMNRSQAIQFAKNSFNASFLDQEDKGKFIQHIDTHAEA